MKPAEKKTARSRTADLLGTGRQSDAAGTYERLYRIVRRIPKGKVATYGQVATLAGFSGQGRLAGYALHGLKEGTDVPWYRVVNRMGRISFPPDSEGGVIQRSLLKSEGVRFNNDGSIPMEKFQWRRF